MQTNQEVLAEIALECAAELLDKTKPDFYATVIMRYLARASHLQPEAPAKEPKADCLDCGVPYGEEGWCDVVLPSPIWNSIAQPHEILCFRCMTKRLEAKGLTNVPVAVVSGPYRDANEEWRLIGWEHGYKVGKEESNPTSGDRG